MCADLETMEQSIRVPIMPICLYTAITTINTTLSIWSVDQNKPTSSLVCLDQARLQTCEPVSIHCSGCAVRVFQKRSSGLPFPLRRPAARVGEETRRWPSLPPGVLCTAASVTRSSDSTLTAARSITGML